MKVPSVMHVANLTDWTSQIEKATRLILVNDKNNQNIMGFMIWEEFTVYRNLSQPDKCLHT